ncbi:hypothetical protein ACQPWW_30025 [Micromonospora sp. CA-240977]|uniref:hypothetical protein n=1 Tax=Micromonospora sp. CA-240977 TaxID=3239957 RepID=UPI003D8DE4E7
MIIVKFDESREWYIQGGVFEDIVDSAPAGMLHDDDLAEHLWPGRAMGWLNVRDMEPGRARRIIAALSAGVVGQLRTVDQSNNKLVEFYEGLLKTAGDARESFPQ